MKNVISTPNAPEAIGPYSQAIDTGYTIYVSGQLPLNPQTKVISGSIAQQTAQSLDNIKSILEAAEYSMECVVKTTVLLSDINDFTAMNEVYASYFTELNPARVCYEVSKLPMGAKIEIDCIAVK